LYNYLPTKYIITARYNGYITWEREASVLESGIRVTRSLGQLFWSGRVGSGLVTGQCDRLGAWAGFCSLCTRFIVAFGERIRHVGICGILCTLYFHVVRVVY